MNDNNYTAGVMRTFNHRSEHEDLVNCALGVTGEGGELADMIKKHVFHGHYLDKIALIKECGDILYYVTALLTLLESDLPQAKQMNADKLNKRYPNGFTVEDSIARKDVK